MYNFTDSLFKVLYNKRHLYCHAVGKDERMTKNQLNQTDIIQGLNTRWIGKQLTYYETIDSTNNEAKRQLDTAESGSVFVASHQSSGRGRTGKRWSTYKNHSIACSILIKPTSFSNPISLLTQLTAAAVHTTLSNYLSVQIKWPNDILSHGKKISGILVETIYEGNKLKGIIIGVGMNVYKQPFHLEQLEQKAASLEDFSSESLNINIITAQFLTAFESFYDAYLLDGNLAFLDICRKHSIVIGKKVNVWDGKDYSEVFVKGINNSGELEVIYNHQTDVTTLTVGELSIRGIDEYI